MAERTVNILGNNYTIKEDVNSKDDKYLEQCDGYCDYTTRTIVVKDKGDDCEIKDFEYYKKEVKRHEMVHAFFFESGLNSNSVWGLQRGEAQPEQLVEWIAVQFPKMLEAFKTADAI